MMIVMMMVLIMMVILFVPQLVFERISTDPGAVVGIADVRLLDCKGKFFQLQMFGRVQRGLEHPSELSDREAGNSLCHQPPDSASVVQLGVDV